MENFKLFGHSEMDSAYILGRAHGCETLCPVLRAPPLGFGYQWPKPLRANQLLPDSADRLCPEPFPQSRDREGV